MLYQYSQTVNIKNINVRLSQENRKNSEGKFMGTIAVIDTETTWKDEVMSIGVVTTDDKEF